MSAILPPRTDLEHGIFMYLCSGKMTAFPLATRVDLVNGVFEVRDHEALLASFSQGDVWCCSREDTSPSLG